LGLFFSLLNFADAQVTGKVFQDFNANGMIGTADFGLAGVTVKAFSATGAQVGTTQITDANGNYSIAVPAGTQVRIEFSGLPAGFYSGPYGTASGTAVQFTTGGTSSVNLGVNDPDNYCQDNPKVYTPVWTNGNPLGGGSAGTTCALFQFNYNDNGATANPIGTGPNATCAAITSSVGALYGVAYQKSSNAVFTSAVLRRHAGFGPLGVGGIYVTTNANGTTPTTSSYINLSNLGINLGADPHTGLPIEKIQPNTDPNAFCLTGKLGMGDLDISDDGSKLYVVNLYEKKIHEITIGNPYVAGSSLTAANIRTWSIPNPGCSNGEFVPWGLKFYRDKLYVGVTCTGETSGNIADLKGTIYELIPSTGVFTNVISSTTFSMQYASFTTWNCYFSNSGQPMISDIEFDERGNMTIGIMDRVSLQWGRQNLPPNGGALVDGFANGNIEKLCYNSATNRFTLEDNGVVCGVTGAGQNNGQGPGGGEFYNDLGVLYPHEESAFGALAILQGSGEVLWTAQDPINYWAGGVFHNKTETGAQLATKYELYQSVDPATFGKAGGLGDLEVLCNLAPLEIGNRIWMDSDNDGIQDANEMGLASVQVQLYKNGSLVASTSTSSNGQYIFTNAMVTGGLLPNMAYEIRIPNYLSIPALAGKNLTTSNVNGNADDIRDSDGSISGVNIIIPITTGVIGDNNHTYDIGFKSCSATVNAGSDVTICPGSSTTIAANGANGVPPYVYTWNNGLNTGQSKTVTPLVTTTYIVTVTDANNCTSTDAVIVTIAPRPIANAGSDVSICSGSSTNLTVNGSSGTTPYTYLWSTNSSSQTISVNPTITTTYTVTITDANNCTNTDEVIVTVNPKPTVSITKVDATCGLSNGSATANPSGGLTPYTYAWSNTKTSQTISNLSAGNYTVTVTDSRGCTGTASVSISNTNGASVNAGPDVAICNGSATSLTATPSGGTVPYTYAWSNGGTTQVISVSPAVTTTYTVTVTDNIGCLATDQVVVTVNARPSLTNISKIDAKCGQANGSATANPTGGLSPYTYIWSSGENTQTISNKTAGTYLVTVTDSRNCTANASIVINNIAGPTVNAGSDATICSGKSVNLTAAPSGGTSPFTYAWSGGAGNTQTVTVSPTGSITYTVTVTDANNCTATDNVIVNVNPVPNVNAGSDVGVCVGSSATLIAVGSGGTPSYSYTWNNPASSGAQKIVTPTTTTTYTVTVADQNGCTNTDQVIVTVNAKPNVVASADVAICVGSSTTISANANGGLAPYTYNWNNGIGSGQSKIITPTTTTTYIVTVVDANGCTNTDQVIVTVNAKPSSGIRAPNTVCALEGATFEAFPPVVGATYNWNTDGGNPATSNLDNITVTWPTTYIGTTRTVSLTVTDVNGCSSVYTHPINVTQNPVASAGPDKEICEGGSTTIGGTPSGPTGSTFYWTPNTFLNSNTVANPIAFPPVTTTYTLVTTINGCTKSDQITVRVNALLNPIASATADPSRICTGKNTTLTGSALANGGAGAPFAFVWNNSLGSGAIKTATPPSTTNYIVTVTDKAGCTDTASVRVQVDPCGSIGDYVWVDTDGDGVQDPTELGLNGVTVLLKDALGNVLATTVTTTGGPLTSAGYYNFPDLFANNYKVMFMAPTGYNLTDDNSATSTDENDSDADPTTGTTATISLAPGQMITNVDAGLYQPASLGNYVWEDLNKNGMQEAGEPGVNGVTVLLKNSTGTTLQSTVTVTGGPNTTAGYYQFTNLAPGNYILMFMTPTGYNETTPNTTADNNDSDADPTTGNSPITNLVSGESDQTVDAGIYRPATIGDYVWRDTDGDGIQDPGEPGINGVTVLLKDATTLATLQTTVTTTGGPSGTAGYYNFTVDPGTYVVMFMAPTGNTLSPTGNGTTTTDSNPNPTTGNSSPVTVTSGGSNQTIDAGLYQPASLGNYVWEDLNKNGIQEAGEPGVNGVTVLLKNAGGIVLQSTVTTTNAGTAGYYQFTNLAPGDYIVMFMTPTGYNETTPNTTADNNDSDADPATGNAPVTNLVSGESDQTIDAGIYRPAIIGDYVWRDTDADGIQDPTEAGMNGVTVLLKDPTTLAVLQTTITATGGPNTSAGYYSFTVEPGSYVVMFMAPAGSSLSPTGNGTTTTDSDPNPLTGNTNTVVVTSGSTNYTIDAGMKCNATVTAGSDVAICFGSSTTLVATGSNGVLPYQYAWNNPASIGTTKIVNPTLTTIYTVTVTDNVGCSATDQVTVTVNPNPTVNAGVDQAICLGFSANLSATGNSGLAPYTFNWDNGLGIGQTKSVSPVTTTTYTVTITDANGCSNTDQVIVRVNQNPVVNAGIDQTQCPNIAASLTANANGGLAPYTFSWDNGLGFGQTKSVSPTTTTTYTVTVTDANGCTNTDQVQIIVIQCGALGNYVWEDLDGDGVQDAGEPGINGVTVILKDGNGNPISGRILVTSTNLTTGQAGYYQFANLPSGNYIVMFMTPTGYSLTDQNSPTGTASTNSDPNTTTGNTAVIFLAPGETNNDVDAGLTKPAMIGDYVWRDTDGDGIQDPTETGLNGVTVLLKDATTLAVIQTTVTTTGGPLTSAGYYNFTVDPGTYVVMFMAPTGNTLSPTGNGTVGTDSNPNPTTGNTTPIAVTSGSTNTTIDAGLYQPASLGNYVWEDLNKNGIQEAGEPGVNGVTVLLKNVGGIVLQTTVTTTNAGTAGYYQFTNLAPGDYIVMFMTPTGYNETTPNTTADNNDSDADPTTGNAPVTNLVSGESDQTIDAGIYRPAIIGDYVWNDTDGDGVQDPTETGLNGVTVLLKDATTLAVLQTTVTTTGPSGTAGYYSFSVDPGTYVVMFMTPTGGVLSPTGNGTTTTDSDPNPTTGNSTPITVVSGGTNTTIDAGIYQPASIGNYVWEDLNKNGIQEAGEPGVNGVTVLLKNAVGTVLQTTVTTTNAGTAGYYQFTNLAPGDYMVMFMTPTGYNETTPNTTADNNDSDADPATGNAPLTNLVSGESDQTIDAGIYRPATIGDYVWRDTDGDGVQDPTEVGMNGVTVLLKDPTTLAVLQTTVTTTGPSGNAGYYSFTVEPGSYVVMFMAPTGSSLSPTGNGTTSTDSDPNPLTGNTNTVVVTSGSTITTIDAGMKCNATVSAGSDVAVCSGSSATLLATASNGVSPYQFAWNNPASVGSTKIVSPSLTTTYTVTVTDNVGCSATDQVIVTVNLNPTVNAGVDQSICLGYSANLSATGNSGLAPYTFNWDNGLGLGQNKSVNPITTTTYTVTITDANGCSNTDQVVVRVNQNPVVNAGIDQTQCPSTPTSLTANANGGLAPYTFSWDNGLGLGQTKTVSPTTTTTYNVTVTDANGCTNTDQVQIIVIQCGALGNYVWEDLDGDGVQDAGEPGINGVTVILKDGLGFPIPGKVLVTSTNLTTGQAGYYQFTNLPAGSYIVMFMTPTGYTLTDQNSPTGTAVTNSDPNPTTGNTAVINLGAGETNNDVDAGLTKPASIGDYVWRDSDGDGVQDPTETGLNGVTVLLKDATTLTVLQTTVTTTGGPLTSPGYYTFNVEPGTYVVMFMAPAGNTLSPTGNGTVGTDSNPNPTTGNTAPIVVTSGSTNTTIDAGLYQPASLGNYVWFDEDKDGVQDANEVGIDGFVVNLYNAAGVLQASTTTIQNPNDGSHGYYQFTNLAPGAYYVQIVPTAGLGYTSTIPNNQPLANEATDSDVNGLHGVNTTSDVTLVSGQNYPDLDAGFYLNNAIGNFVWNDINKNGIQDLGESGINGITVTLYSSTGAVIEQMITTNTPGTGQAGWYQFDNLLPGNYYVKFDVPTGYYATLPNTTGEATDSDLTGTNGTGTTALINVTAGTVNNDVDAGIYRAVKIGNYVWNDTGADNLGQSLEAFNGIQDPGELPQTNLTVTLKNLAGITVQTTTTDSKGEYCFFVEPNSGSYYVEFALPSGFGFTSANVLANTLDATDSDVTKTFGEGTTTAFTVGTLDNLTIDAGIYLLVLPLELLEFEAEYVNKNANLTWSTTNEVNSDKFIIERRYESESNFTQIGNVKANNVASAINEYSFVDQTINKDGKYYYRLKVLDFDKRFKYSNIRTIDVNTGSAIDVIAMPNPARDILNVQITGNKLNVVKYELIDLYGRVIISQTESLSSSNSIHNVKIDVSNFKSGTYFLRMNMKNKTLTEKITITH
jgi:hypothetical protein